MTLWLMWVVAAFVVVGAFAGSAALSILVFAVILSVSIAIVRSERTTASRPTRVVGGRRRLAPMGPALILVSSAIALGVSAWLDAPWITIIGLAGATVIAVIWTPLIARRT